MSFVRKSFKRWIHAYVGIARDDCKGGSKLEGLTFGYVTVYYILRHRARDVMWTKLWRFHFEKKSNLLAWNHLYSAARNGTWLHFKNYGSLVSLDYLTGKSHEGEKAILRRRLIAKVTWLKLYKYLLIKLRWFTVLTTYAFDWTKAPVYFCWLPFCFSHWI